MPEGREIEVKLAMDPEAAEKLARRAKSSPEQPRGAVHHLRSIYFDSDDQQLWNSGLSLRIRHEGRHRIQTVKAEDGGAVGLFDRPEWEAPVGGDVPEAAAAHGSPAESIIAKGKLKPVFEVNVTRTTSYLQNNGAEIELAWDQGEIAVDGRSERISEVELELKKGDPSDLYQLIAELAREAPMALATDTKAERGYRLLAKAKPEPATAEDVPLKRKDTTEASFRAIVRECLRQIVANAPGVVAGDEGGIHQMRIGIRRLRAAMTIFRKVIADPRTDEIKDELRWLAGELGPARDADVFMSEVIAPLVDKRPDDPDLRRRKKSARGERSSAHRRAAAAASSDRFRKLGLDILLWAETGAWRLHDATTKLRAKPVGRFAEKAVARRRKKIEAAGPDLSERTPEERHRLRIKVKKLRYLIEFLAPALGKRMGKRAGKEVSTLKSLQDALGDLHDIETRTDGNGAAPAKANGQHAPPAEDVIKDYFNSRREPLMAAADKAFGRFTKSKPITA